MTSTGEGLVMTVVTDQSDPKSVIPGRSHVWGAKCHVWARSDAAQSSAVRGRGIHTLQHFIFRLLHLKLHEATIF